jgi:hypothetical protein
MERPEQITNLDADLAAVSAFVRQMSRVDR